MGNIFDNHELDIPCQSCGAKKIFKVKELSRNPEYICQKCGVKNIINADELTKGIKEAERKMMKLFKK